jgi:hypothetical protein
MRRWNMQVYLDVGMHVSLEDRPFYYCGVLNFYKLAHLMRADINKPEELPRALEKFLAARDKLKAEGGGVVSIMYHPCEFAHKEFWDGVNFRNGANPPREKWRLPRTKTPEESATAYRIFEQYIQFMKRLDDVQFITASEAGKLYRDKAGDRRFSLGEIRAICQSIGPSISFFENADYFLSAAEVFALLNHVVATNSAGKLLEPTALSNSPLGPSEQVPVSAEEVSTDASQFQRTARDVDDYLKKQGRIPSTVWLGSRAVPPESYLVALAQVTPGLLDGKPIPDPVCLRPANLAIAKNVSDDRPELWRWVIFPRGFRAPRMMELAKRQAWTLKPAKLARS